MKQPPYYPNLVSECARKGVTNLDLAAEIKCTPRALHNKMTGKSFFTWPEVDAIHKKFFPELTVDYMMQTREMA